MSIDFVVDRNGNMAVDASPGGGAYATTTIVDAGTGVSAFVAPRTTVDDVANAAVQFGGSATVGVGIGGSG